MARRNYNAFIKAARKTGGLSLPAARKAYKQITERLGRPAKGIDVSKHPRIFKQTITTKAGRRKPGFADQTRRPGASAKGSKRVRSTPIVKPTSSRGAAGGVQPPRKAPAQPPGPARPILAPVEYVSTPEYTKRGPRGTFNLQLQIHITGPPGMTKRALDNVAANWLRGGGTPNGIEVKALGWQGKNPTEDRRGMRVARSNFSRIPFTF